jgi:hypothetical protein
MPEDNVIKSDKWVAESPGGRFQQLNQDVALLRMEFDLKVAQAVVMAARGDQGEADRMLAFAEHSIAHTRAAYAEMDTIGKRMEEVMQQQARQQSGRVILPRNPGA